MIGLVTSGLVVLALVAPAESSRRQAGSLRAASSHAFATALVIQRDGKLVAAGWSDRGARSGGFALARYLPNGTLDAGFGRKGKAVISLGRGGGAEAVALQPDAKIVAAGWVASSASRHDFALVRFRKGGSLDPSFGNGGRVVTSFGRSSTATGVVVRPDGKLVAAGWIGKCALCTQSIAVARYTRFGRLDPTFGDGGKIVTAGGGGAALAIQPDGKLVVAYVSGLARYDGTGTLDPEFGRAGRARTPIGAYALAIEAGGKIVAGGLSRDRDDNDDNGTPNFALARHMADGRLDPSFGSGGKVLTDFDVSFDGVNAIAARADGTLVAVGETVSIGNTGAFPNEPPTDVALVGYAPDGRLDPSFGRGGKVLTSFSGWETRATDVVLQPDGKLVVAGFRGLGGDTTPREFLLIRYTPRGRLDASFGRGGKVLTSFGSR